MRTYRYRLDPKELSNELLVAMEWSNLGMCQILQGCDDDVWIMMVNIKIVSVVRPDKTALEVKSRARYADAAIWARLSMQTTGVNTCMTSCSALLIRKRNIQTLLRS